LARPDFLMTERLLDHDPLTGMKTWFSSDDENGGTWRIRYEQDCTDLLDANKAAQAESMDRRSEFWHAARVPAVVQMEWLVKHGVRAWDKDHAEGVKRLLNDPEYRYLRVNHFIM